MKTGSVARNTIYLYVFTLAKILAPLVTQPYLTRVLSLDAYGFISYAKSYASYVQLLIDFGFLFSATKAIVFVKDSRDNVSEIVGNTIIEKFGLGLLAGLATILCCATMPILSTHPAVVWLYYVSCVTTVFTLDFLFRGIERMEHISLPFVIAKIAVVILTIIFVQNDSDMILIPVFDIVGNVISGLVSFFLARRLGINIAVSEAKEWFHDIKESSVYFFSNIATTFLGALTTIVAGFFLPVSEIALWSVCMMVVSAAKSMYTPISNGLFPQMVITRDLSLANKAALIGSIPMVLGCFVVFCYGNELMALIGGSQYVNAGQILKCLIPVFVCSFYSMLYGWPALGAIERNKSVTITTVISAIVQVVLMTVMIAAGKCSLVGFALCCSISEGALLVMRLLLVVKHSKEFSTR